MKEKSIADSCSLGFLRAAKQGGVQVKPKGGKKFKGKPKEPTFSSGTSTASPIDGNHSPSLCACVVHNIACSHGNVLTKALNLLCLTLALLLSFCLPLHGLLLTIFNLFLFYVCVVFKQYRIGFYFFFFFASEKQGFIITCSQ